MTLVATSFPVGLNRQAKLSYFERLVTELIPTVVSEPDFSTPAPVTLPDPPPLPKPKPSPRPVSVQTHALKKNPKAKRWLKVERAHPSDHRKGWRVYVMRRRRMQLGCVLPSTSLSSRRSTRRSQHQAQTDTLGGACETRAATGVARPALGRHPWTRRWPIYVVVWLVSFEGA